MKTDVPGDQNQSYNTESLRTRGFMREEGILGRGVDLASV